MNRTEEQIIKKAGNALEKVPAFKVEMGNFEFFYHGREKRTVYIKVSDSGTTQHIYTLLADELKVRTEKFTPHLTVIKSILTRELEGIEDDLMNYEYSNEFHCEKVTFLKREINDGFKTSYQPVSEFRLK